MPITRAKKQEILASLTKALKEAASVVFVNFHGLPVSEASEMRRGLSGEGVSYTVAKKTLASKAMKEAGILGEAPALEGELGLAYGNDLTAPARGIYGFQKKYEGKLSILGGVFEGKFLGKEEMLSIAQIPSQKTLYAQFVNLINSPLQGLAVALKAIAEKKA